MKYINTNASFVWGKDKITKEYLIGVKERNDTLLDLENETYFDTEKNDWIKIPYDEEIVLPRENV